MPLSKWLLAGGAYYFMKKVKKAKKAKKQSSVKIEKEESELEEILNENNRIREVNSVRREMPCSYNDGLSREDFVSIAERCAKKIKRIKDVRVNRGMIICTVVSQTGISSWNFDVDFNNWGHITGVFWTYSSNSDSSIPRNYGYMVSGAIHDYLSEHGISIPDFSDYVDNNKNLGTKNGLQYTKQKTFLGGLLGEKVYLYQIGYDSEMLLHEHLYPVISIIKDAGFKNIRSVPIWDINDRNDKYKYEVEQIVINGVGFFESKDKFADDAEVIITYHEKQWIKMPFSIYNLKNKQKDKVVELLENSGFSNIYLRKQEDLVTGILVKDGTVETVLVRDDERLIEKGEMYPYDEELLIVYHTFQRK